MIRKILNTLVIDEEDKNNYSQNFYRLNILKVNYIFTKILLINKKEVEQYVKDEHTIRTNK